jgi:hypothetical protein
MVNIQFFGKLTKRPKIEIQHKNHIFFHYFY